ncbi:MAG: MarR family transcriptional regulator [Marmoricola sp.]
MSAERQELARRLSMALGMINRRIRAVDDGLSVGLVSALSTVMAHDGIRAGDLARIEKVAAPSITRAVAELEARGLVERSPDPDDGRASLIRATPLGVKAVERARDGRAEQLISLLDRADGMTLARLRDAVDVLEGLLSHADSV